MKKILRVIAVNVLVLAGLLAVLELALRVFGVRPIYRPGAASSETAQYKRICDALRRGERPTVSRMFYTDGSGVFRADAGAFSSPGGNGAQGVSVNRDGFRGNEFVPPATAKTTIFFLGDSFTWGSLARPITESFADIVGRSGYHVYNGGIPGTDPQQYALVAEKYVPLLKPDVTAVCLYLGNDLKSFSLPQLPNRSLHYVTSLGFIRGYDDRGRYFADGEEAVAYLRRQKCGCIEGLGDAFLYHTVVGKAAYGLFHMKNHLRSDPQRRWVVECLERVRRVCRRQQSRFILFLIPNKKPEKNRHNLMLVRSFPGFAGHYPGKFTLADYAPDPDNHFNNQGHRRFADFILATLAAQGFPPDS